VLSYQYTNGGWPKNQVYDVMGSGGSAAGSFDNNATISEMVYLAQIYKNTGTIKYRDAARRAMNFTLSAQYSSGAWPQVFPLAGGYQNHGTFNDNAMASILTALHHASKRSVPFDTDIFNDSDRVRFQQAIDRGVDYILRSQWRQNGILTTWCAQHGATDYLPKMARAYELESLSGSESVEITGFLMTQPQTAQIQTAVRAAVAWFRSPNTYLADHAYDSSTVEKIVPRQGSRMWYRFYDLNTNRGFFSDRDSRKVYNIMEISEERREGYSWGGDYGTKIINYATSVGY
jgi:PelA/Pel-15E family pectate lyase